MRLQPALRVRVGGTTDEVGPSFAPPPSASLSFTQLVGPQNRGRWQPSPPVDPDALPHQWHNVCPPPCPLLLLLWIAVDEEELLLEVQRRPVDEEL